ncbi:DUF4012 domain-containing protein [Candidatus Roizmanbacteria bacterium]|jgi:hypothetical protein|nr:DUF4012 domain-containing protein [Candidatus Roizmanbacteria bacterium]
MKKRILFFFVVVLAIFSYFFIYTPYQKIKKTADPLIAAAKELKTTFTKNDIDLLNNKLSEFGDKYAIFEKEAGSVYWASFIPYVADFKNGVEAGRYVLTAGQETVKTITPYADLIGFKKGQTSFVERSSEDRLQTAILTLDKVLGNLDKISSDISEAEKRINKIDPKRYPEKIGSTLVRSKIINVKEQFVGMASLFVDAKPLVKKLPEIFGTDKEKTYLLLFQNDKERRATGGFLTAYAVFKVKNGKLKIEKSEDIYSLDNSISSHPEAPREILTYHKDVYKFNIRDSNLSPDLPTSVDLFNSLYKKSGSRVDYDGIIMLDSKVLVDMLTIFGDTEAGGVVFSASIDKRCDCPQVLYKLFDMVDRPTPYLRENRKGILGELMYALFYKALGFSPSKYWGTLAQQMFKNMQEKHILLYFTDKELQTSVEKLNFAGRIRDFDGDYLHVNNVNFAGAKSNLFVSEIITSQTKNEGGRVVREVTIDYRNPYPHSDCNLERGGLCLNATLRNWLRVYVPKGSTLLEFKGSEKKVQTYDELGKTVFEGFLTVNPLGKATVVVRYSLPASLSGKNDRLLIQKQAGADDQKLKVEINGKKVYDGVFDVDKEL